MPRATGACRWCPCRNAEVGYLLLTGACDLRGREMTLSFPPFTQAVIWLLGINTAVFLGLSAFGSPLVSRLGGSSISGSCSELTVFHFAIWQIVTYSFIHFGFWHWFGNMLGLWMFGASFESSWGMRRFLELFFAGSDRSRAHHDCSFVCAHSDYSRTR